MAMDPNPKNFPVLSYVMARLPSITRSSSSSSTADIEQPPSKTTSSQSSASSSSSIEIVSQMPRLAHPKVLASMTTAISDVAQTRSALRKLGPRPDHETVDKARTNLAEIEASMSESFEEIALSPSTTRSPAAATGEDQRQLCEATEEEKDLCRSILKVDQLHEEYEKLLHEAEERLVRIYGDVTEGEPSDEKKDGEAVEEEVDEEVVRILRMAETGKSPLERVDLSRRKLRLIPEAFGRIEGLRVLILSNNQLEGIPDSIAGLQNLEELDASTNLLESLPDSIGLLSKLKILNVSGNKLTALPDSISHCGSLVVLDVSFNHLTYLPTKIGYELVNLEKLLIYLNKIRSLPTSIGEMRSLRCFDAHFNELGGLPLSFGSLTNLEFLDLSSNFNDLTELPETFCDLISLEELDLSNNQIHALPDSFGRLESLTKLKLDQNPLVIPPGDVVEKGAEAVKEYMAKRLIDKLAEKERKRMIEENEKANAGWLTRTTSKLKTYVSDVSEYLAAKSPRDAYLNQQL